MKFQNQTLHLLQFKTNLNMFMCVLFCYRLFVSLRMRMPTSNQQPQNKNIRIVRIAGVPSGQALRPSVELQEPYFTKRRTPTNISSNPQFKVSSTFW